MTNYDLIGTTFWICVCVFGSVFLVVEKLKYDLVVEGSFECDIGELDFDYRSDWNYLRNRSADNLVYDDLYLPRSFNAYGIDGTTCKGTYFFKGNMVTFRGLEDIL